VGVGVSREWGVTESWRFCQVCRHSKKVGNPWSSLSRLLTAAQAPYSHTQMQCVHIHLDINYVHKSTRDKVNKCNIVIECSAGDVRKVLSL
jgi:hypothetical protein